MFSKRHFSSVSVWIFFLQASAIVRWKLKGKFFRQYFQLKTGWTLATTTRTQSTQNITQTSPRPGRPTDGRLFRIDLARDWARDRVPGVALEVPEAQAPRDSRALERQLQPVVHRIHPGNCGGFFIVKLLPYFCWYLRLIRSIILMGVAYSNDVNEKSRFDWYNWLS